jgi:hypothetical protein
MLLETFTGREPNPVVPTLTPESEAVLLERSGPEAVAEFLKARARVLTEMAVDPFRCGYEPEIWGKADEQIRILREQFPVGVIQLLLLGGNRSSKTYYAAKRIMQMMIRKPGTRVWCLQSTEVASRADQQGLMFDLIPPEWRPVGGKVMGRHKTTRITYSNAGGFSENIFVLNNASTCWFRFYGADVKTIEGAELDACWCDELVKPDWIEALRFRLITRNGLLLTTFTPAEGYSATVAEYRDNCRLIEETTGELLAKNDNRVPRVEQCTGERVTNARIVYFHTADNPFGNYPAMKIELANSNRERILMRAYGVATKTHSAQFFFVPSVHIISANRVLEFQKKYLDGTRYHLVDPCSGRPWFMLWFFCIPGRTIIYREWPSFGHLGAHIQGYGDLGAWAIAGPAPDGARGPAQVPLQFGLDRYKEEILRQEQGELIFERWMDARYANSAKTEREGTTTLIEQMEDLDLQFIAMTSEKRILGTPDGSIDLINSALYYDRETELGLFSAALGKINEPELLVSEHCPNVINALQNWTGMDGQHGACKDPIDVLRGFYLSRLGFIDEKTVTLTKGGCY